MNRRMATLGVAAAGVIAGAVGIGFLAAPAGAGQAPTLPSVTPDALVASVLTANVPAMSGTVEIDNNLGLPALPGLPLAATGQNQIRVWTDGNKGVRVSIPTMSNEQTVVANGRTVYSWDSRNRTVVETTMGHKSGKAAAEPNAGELDPTTLAKDLVAAIKADSTISVDGTDLVANRPVYELVLTPKPSERTLLREVRIAIDADQHIPLQLTVLGNNSTAPAIRVGFSSLSLGTQDPALFQFTPPPGSTVVNGDNPAKQTGQAIKDSAPTLVGKGWDTVLVAKVPSSLSEANQGKANQAPADNPGAGSITGMGGSSSDNGVSGLLQRFGTKVSGSWGTGYAISTDIGTAIITSDGRVAIGFVPEQVLSQALSNAK